MRLIKKLTQKDKETKYDLTIMCYFNIVREIEDLKNDIECLKNSRKLDQHNQRLYYSNEILIDIARINDLYKMFIKDFENNEEKYLMHWSVARDAKCYANMLYILEKKKELRSEFEKIYINFKKMVINLKHKDVPMNIILNCMRAAFDFDSKKSGDLYLPSLAD